MKSIIDIHDDIYQFIKKSELVAAISGKLSGDDQRPKGSTLEDIVIQVPANVNGQIQEATVYVDIYANDLKRSNGQSVWAKDRLRELGKIACKVLKVGNGDTFRFELESQTYSQYSDSGVHVLINKLNYKQLNE